MTDLTAANAIITLTAPGVFNTPQTLKMFSADDVYDTPSIAAAEEQIGVDGYLSAGFVFVAIEQNFTFMGDSVSNAIFQQIYRFEQTNRSKVAIQGVTILPSLGLKFVSPRGFLKLYTPMPSLGKIVKPLKYSVVWERANPQPA